MILADITVSLKSPLFSVDHIIAFVGIILNIGTLAFAIWSNHKDNIGTTERQEKLEKHQKNIEDTQESISVNLNNTADTLTRINKSMAQLNKEQQELAKRISSIQIVMLQSEYKNFFDGLTAHRLHVRKVLSDIDEYNKKGETYEILRQSNDDIHSFGTFFSFHNILPKTR